MTQQFKCFTSFWKRSALEKFVVQEHHLVDEGIQATPVQEDKKSSLRLNASKTTILV